MVTQCYLIPHLSELNLPLEDGCDPMVQPQTPNGSNIVIRHIFILKITCTLLFRSPFTTIHDNFCNDFRAPVTREKLHKVVFSYFISCLHALFWKVTFFLNFYFEKKKKKSFRVSLPALMVATMAAWVTLPFFVVVLFIARPRCPLKCETNVRHTSETRHPNIHWCICISCMWTAMFGLQ